MLEAPFEYFFCYYYDIRNKIVAIFAEFNTKHGWKNNK